MSKAQRYFSLISGIILIAFSFILLANKAEGIMTMAIFLGFAFFMHGIGELSLYFSGEKDAKHTLLLVGGMISIIFGIWTLTVPGTLGMAIAIPLIIATWITFFGALRIAAYINLRKFSKKLAYINLLLGIIGIILGIVLLRHPEVTDFLVTIILFIVFLTQGIASVVNFFWYKK